MVKKSKYRMHGAAKVCFILSIILLCISIMNLILCVTVLPGVYIFTSLILAMVASILMTVTAVDRVKFEQKNHPDEVKKNENAVIYIIIGIVLGLIWGKYLFKL